ncbi:MAG: TetR family transcriptional regulator [Kutzneria sp.]|nr:TetR family transcriptional regulator [Kutzneria sp.]MBV9845471.1 TetR family transcriptional regulator [Kutzneria sp.]
MRGVDADLPLRERKKRKTRKHISDVATRLFIRRGFDQVTVAEVAAAADVAKMTVFNYFPSKEDLVFDDALLVERWMAALVRDRAPGMSVVEAVRADFLASLNPRDLADGEWRYGRLHGDLVHFWRMVEDSPALRAREHQLAERMAHVLAESLGGSLQDRVVASQLCAVLTVLDGEIRRLVLAGETPEAVLAVIVPAAERAFEGLANGLRDYGRAAPPDAG